MFLSTAWAQSRNNSWHWGIDDIHPPPTHNDTDVVVLVEAAGAELIGVIIVDDGGPQNYASRVVVFTPLNVGCGIWALWFWAGDCTLEPPEPLEPPGPPEPPEPPPLSGMADGEAAAVSVFREFLERGSTMGYDAWRAKLTIRPKEISKT